MIRLRVTYLLLFLLVISNVVRAQVRPDTAAADSVTIQPGEQFGPMGEVSTPDSVAADSTKELFKVIPWQYHAPLNTEIVSTDSTLRWQNWSDWVTFRNRDPGVISYRMGTFLRTNSFLHDAQEPRYLKLSWENINLNDPVSGAAHWNLMPMHKLKKVYEKDTGLYHETSYYLRHYYLNNPLTKLNYDESKFDYRSLEFTVSQNFSQRTNVEISYWDRRGGGEYNNSNVSGRQIFARIFHQLDHKQTLKLAFLNNNYAIGEPFGYAISDLALFPFDRFTASPNSSSAESEVKATTLFLNYYRRGPDTTEVTDNLQAGLYLNNRGRSLDFNADSTFYKVRSYGAHARKWLNLGPLQLEGGGSYELFTSQDAERSNLLKDNWGLLQSDGTARIAPVGFLSLTGRASYKSRSDGYDSYSYSAGAEILLGRFFSLSTKASMGTIMPTPQQLYWSSNQYQGSTQLINEEVTELSADLSLKPFETLELGIKGQFKEIENGIMVGADSSFTNITPYRSLSATPYINFSNRLFELSGSATYHRFDNTGQIGLLDENERIWLKGSAYIKGYLFNRATYVKAGFAGMLSPFRYRAAHYNPVLDFWQPLGNDQLLPSFDRLDFDVSARIRKIMIVLRWENITDDFSQLGYFETANYPMGQRRFIFGLRVFFRN